MNRLEASHVLTSAISEATVTKQGRTGSEAGAQTRGTGCGHENSAHKEVVHSFMTEEPRVHGRKDSLTINKTGEPGHHIPHALYTAHKAD